MEAHQFAENEKRQQVLMQSTRPQRLNWSFNEFDKGADGASVPLATSQKFMIENDRPLKNGLHNPKWRLASPAFVTTEETQLQDTEMLDADEATKAPLGSASIKRYAKTISTLEGSSAAYFEYGRDHVKIIDSTRRLATFGTLNASQTQTPCGTSRNPICLDFVGKSTITSPSSRPSPHSPNQFYRKPDQGRGRITTYFSTDSSSEDSDLEILDAAAVAPPRCPTRPQKGVDRAHIAAYQSPSSSNEERDIQILDPSDTGNFRVYRNTLIGPGDYLNEVDFEKWIKENAPRSEQEINEDDDAVIEDFVEEDFLVDHLQSLAISTPENSLPIPERRRTYSRKSEVDAIEHKEFDLHVGVTVELQNSSFLRIDSIWKDDLGSATIKGYRLARNGYCGSKLPDRRINELVWVNEIDEDEHRAGLESVLYEEKVSEVKRVREVVYTNCPWPMVSFSHDYDHRILNEGSIENAAAEENGTLYCRWKYIQVNSKLKTDAEACLALLSDKEATGRGLLEASLLRAEWRGELSTTPGGSGLRPVFDIETEEKTYIPQYTLGDCFCGAGGISRGAAQAGLRVAWGFDQDEAAIGMHVKNFERYGTQSLALTDSDFIDLIRDKPELYRTDVAHYSPPCQPFSSANHNKNVERDFQNQKALLSLHHLAHLLKPRIATIEETAGLMHRHKQWFNALINIFTSIGYSVRWKIVRCQEHGIPQARIRLLLMAAA
jgi:DNA (cytosine-5)-methyltransferase 1